MTSRTARTAALLAVTVAGGVAAGALGAPSTAVVIATSGIGSALVASHLAASRTAGALALAGDLSAFPVHLPGERVAVGRRVQLRLLPPTRGVWAPGLLCVRLDDVRFAPAREAHAERAWWDRVERVELSALLGATVIRVHGGSGPAQFVVQQPLAAVRDALAPYVTLAAPPAGPASAALPTLEPVQPVAVADLDLSILDGPGNNGYGRWPYPHPRDDEIAALVPALAAPGAPRPSTEQRDVVRAFAARMATLARREHSPERLRLGLAAAALTSDREDIRDTLLVLPLLWRSAEVLGYDPHASFRATSAVIGRGPLAEFTHRSAENRTIGVMGYVEVDDENGFRYERTW